MYRNLLEFISFPKIKYKICKRQNIEVEYSKLVIYVTALPKKGPKVVPVK